MSPVVIFLSFPVYLKIVQCHLSILRKDNVPCRYFLNIPVDLKVVQCHLSNKTIFFRPLYPEVGISGVRNFAL